MAANMAAKSSMAASDGGAAGETSSAAVGALARQLRSVQARWEVERAAILTRWGESEEEWEAGRAVADANAALRLAYREEEVRALVGALELAARDAEERESAAAAAMRAAADAIDGGGADADGTDGDDDNGGDALLAAIARLNAAVAARAARTAPEA